MILELVNYKESEYFIKKPEPEYIKGVGLKVAEVESIPIGEVKDPDWSHVL